MKLNEKELLLEDLCARLPYSVHCRVFKLNETIKENDDILCGVAGDNVITLKSDKDECLMYYQIKPYLFPISSMTEEQKKEYEDALTYHDYVEGGWTIAKSFDNEYIIPYWFVDFCNKKSFRLQRPH